MSTDAELSSQIKDTLEQVSGTISYLKKSVDTLKRQFNTLENSHQNKDGQEEDTETKDCFDGQQTERQRTGYAGIFQVLFEEIVEEIDLRKTLIIDNMRTRDRISQSDCETIQGIEDRKDQNRRFLLLLIVHWDEQSNREFIDLLNKDYKALAEKIQMKYNNHSQEIQMKETCVSCKIKMCISPRDIMDKLFTNGILKLNTVLDIMENDHYNPPLLLWNQIFAEITESKRKDKFKLFSESINLKNSDLSKQILENCERSLICTCHNKPTSDRRGSILNVSNKPNKRKNASKQPRDIVLQKSKRPLHFNKTNTKLPPTLNQEVICEESGDINGEEGLLFKPPDGLDTSDTDYNGEKDNQEQQNEEQFNKLNVFDRKEIDADNTEAVTSEEDTYIHAHTDCSLSYQSDDDHIIPNTTTDKGNAKIQPVLPQNDENVKTSDERPQITVKEFNGNAYISQEKEIKNRQIQNIDKDKSPDESNDISFGRVKKEVKKIENYLKKYR